MSDSIDFMRMAAIDVHGHCGTWAGYNLSEASMFHAEIGEVAARAASCAIELTVVSSFNAFDPGPDRPADVDAANRRAYEEVEAFEALRFYVVVNPKRPAWEQETQPFLDLPKCVGVKLHPRFHFWSVEEHGDRLFGFLNERKLLTLTHTGHIGNEPERFIPYANSHPDMKLILAHIGNSETRTHDLQIKAVKMATQGNVWADTSSFNSVTSRLIEYAVDQIGAERILFGTDTPIYFPAMHKARIAYAEIPDDAKRRILYDNAAGLLHV